ncbi:hypothetical protein DN745_11215 [Bradymonas sediminis]|uniref:Uncharacterized protein n=1 Tax=Bradymonas sediminis TaxID=1548548 RepID=A0A2Z4FM37_9DELT|nr:hypothetical protein DN745_11215 [Bradymonas sediminis]
MMPSSGRISASPAKSMTRFFLPVRLLVVSRRTRRPPSPQTWRVVLSATIWDPRTHWGLGYPVDLGHAAGGVVKDIHQRFAVARGALAGLEYALINHPPVLVVIEFTKRVLVYTGCWVLQAARDCGCSG